MKMCSQPLLAALIVLAAGAGFFVGRYSTSSREEAPNRTTSDGAPRRSESEAKPVGVLPEDSDRRSMPVQAQPQPEAELKGGVAQQSMKPVQEAAKSEDQKLRERLTADMARLEAAAKGGRFWAAQRLMCECISVIMDKAGTSIPSPDGPHKLPQESDSFVFLTNGRIYKFRRGEFPEYDAMMKVWNSPNSGGPKSLEDLQSLGMAGSDQQNFELDVETIEQTKIRCQEVLALLGGAR